MKSAMDSGPRDGILIKAEAAGQAITPAKVAGAPPLYNLPKLCPFGLLRHGCCFHQIRRGDGLQANPFDGSYRLEDLQSLHRLRVFYPYGFLRTALPRKHMRGLACYTNIHVFFADVMTRRDPLTPGQEVDPEGCNSSPR